MMKFWLLLVLHASSFAPLVDASRIREEGREVGKSLPLIPLSYPSLSDSEGDYETDEEANEDEDKVAYTSLPRSNTRCSYFPQSDSDCEDSEFTRSFYTLDSEGNQSIYDLRRSYLRRKSEAQKASKPTEATATFPRFPLFRAIYSSLSSSRKNKATAAESPTRPKSFPVIRSVARSLKERSRRRAHEKAEKALQADLKTQRSCLNREELETIELLPPLEDFDFPKMESVSSFLIDDYINNEVAFVIDEANILELLKCNEKLKDSEQGEYLIKFLFHAAKNVEAFLDWKRTSSVEGEVELFLEDAIAYYTKRHLKLQMEFPVKLSLAECLHDQIVQAKFEPGPDFHAAFAEAHERYEKEHKELLLMCLNAIHLAEVLNTLTFIQRRS